MKLTDSTDDKLKGVSRVCSTSIVRCVAWILLVWGVIGGWSILGEWWPRLNVLTKDQLTIVVGLMLALDSRKRKAPNK